MGGTPFRSISTESDQNFSYILCLDENCQNLCFIKKRGGQFRLETVVSVMFQSRYIRGALLQGHFARLVQTVGAKCGSLQHIRYTRGSVFKFVQFTHGSCSQIFRYLTSLMLCSILQGKNSAPENESRSWNRWHTRRSFAPRACPGAKPVVCIGLYFISNRFILLHIIDFSLASS